MLSRKLEMRAENRMFQNVRLLHLCESPAPGGADISTSLGQKEPVAPPKLRRDFADAVTECSQMM